MCLDAIKILERETSSIRQGVIHIHREEDKWYAYEQSAFLLSDMIGGHIVLSRYIVNEWLWLARAEINIEYIPHQYVIYNSHDEYILHIPSDKNFYEWILKLG